MYKIIVAILWLSMSATVFSDVYKWVDESGRVHYGDSPSASAKPEKINGSITTFDAVNTQPSSRPSVTQKKNTNNKKIIMYSTSWCGYCKKARKYFIAKGISFVEYDIEKNARAKRDYDAIGGSGVPVIVKGKKHMQGFSQQSFDRFYGS